MTEHIHYSKELESAILGACLLESSAFGRVYGMIDEQTFYYDDNKAVYSFMREMYDNNLPVDLITVHLHMFDKKVKLNYGITSAYLAKLTTNVVSSAHMEYHCYMLKNMWRKREMVKITSSGIDSTMDTRDQIMRINDQLQNIEDSEFKKSWFTMDEIMFNLVKHQEEITQGKKKFITTGFKAIDKQNGGFSGGQLVIIGARPSVGKSALMGKVAMQQALQKNNVGIISLEMNNNEIAARLSSLETDIEFWRIYRSLFSDTDQQERFYKIINDKLSSMTIYISDKTKVNITEIRAKATKLKSAFGLDCLMIDYLQLVDSSQENSNYNREQEVAKISRGLKLLALEMDIPIIVLCQLNRASTMRKGSSRYPQLSDLRESGAIEQDADVVMMLHRDWLIEGLQVDNNGNSTEFKADLLVQKWRNGATCHLELQFEPEKMKFKEQHIFTHVPRESNQDDNPF